jgi:hypothetical protein
MYYTILESCNIDFMSPPRRRFLQINTSRKHDRVTRANMIRVETDAELQRIRGSVTVGPLAMGGGEYFVGDVSIFLGLSEWVELESLVHTHLESKRYYGGRITLKGGRTFVMFILPDGHGNYVDNNGINYIATTNMIGITRLAGLDTQFTESGCSYEQFMNKVADVGSVVNYFNTFDCKSIVVDHPAGGGKVAFMGFGPHCEINSDDHKPNVERFFRKSHRDVIQSRERRQAELHKIYSSL